MLDPGNGIDEGLKGVFGHLIVGAAKSQGRDVYAVEFDR